MAKTLLSCRERDGGREEKKLEGSSTDDLFSAKTSMSCSERQRQRQREKNTERKGWTERKINR